MKIQWIALLLLPVLCSAQEKRTVGPTGDGQHLVATGQLLRPAGTWLEFGGRPVDLALSRDDALLYVANYGTRHKVKMGTTGQGLAPRR